MSASTVTTFFFFFFFFYRVLHLVLFYFPIGQHKTATTLLYSRYVRWSKKSDEASASARAMGTRATPTFANHARSAAAEAAATTWCGWTDRHHRHHEKEQTDPPLDPGLEVATRERARADLSLLLAQKPPMEPYVQKTNTAGCMLNQTPYSTFSRRRRRSFAPRHAQTGRQHIKRRIV